MFLQKNHSYTVIQLSFVAGKKAGVLATGVERGLGFKLFAGNDFSWRRNKGLETLVARATCRLIKTPQKQIQSKLRVHGYE